MISLFRILMIAVSVLSPGLVWAAKAPAQNAPASTVYRNFTIAGPVTDAKLAQFKKDGGTYVIDLRDADEKGDCGEAITATKLGLKFHWAPMPKTKPVTTETIARVEEIVKQAGDRKVLIYCSSGNRAAAWLAVHLVQSEKMSVDEALKIAHASGLKSTAVEGEVKEFLAKSPH